MDEDVRQKSDPMQPKKGINHLVGILALEVQIPVRIVSIDLRGHGENVRGKIEISINTLIVKI